jgi:hypothetical protein
MPQRFKTFQFGYLNSDVRFAVRHLVRRLSATKQMNPDRTPGGVRYSASSGGGAKNNYLLGQAAPMLVDNQNTIGAAHA